MTGPLDRLARTVSALACASLPALAGVIVVDPGGSGDATDLPQAIAAASEGDVLLVKPGLYSGFTIDGLSVHLVADGGIVKVLGSVVIQNLAASQRVTFDEIDVAPATVDHYVFPPALRIANCAGSVRLERCDVTAPSAYVDTCEGFGWWSPASDAVEVTNCSQIVIATGLLSGGEGVGSSDYWCLDKGSDGGRGLAIENGHVALHDVIARGGDGMYDGYGGVGGNGVHVVGHSDLLASGLFAYGGDGGDSYDFIGVAPIGNGGDGLYAEAGTVVRLLGGGFAGGMPGSTCCWTNFPGQPLNVAGTLMPYSGSPHRLLTSSPAREGSVLVLSVTGQPGDLVWMGLGFGPTMLHLPALNGALYLDPGTLLGPFPLATLAGSQVNVPLAIPELGPGIDVALVDVQVLVLEAAGGRLRVERGGPRGAVGRGVLSEPYGVAPKTTSYGRGGRQQ